MYRLYGSTAALQGADGPSSTQGLGEEEKGGALLESLLDETSALAHACRWVQAWGSWWRWKTE